MNPLNNHRQTSLILGIILRSSWPSGWPVGPGRTGRAGRAGSTSVAGVFWIGLLYYFTSPRPPRWRTPQPTRAARAAPRHEYVAPRPCSGSLGGARDLARKARAPQGKLRHAFTFHVGIRGESASARGSARSCCSTSGGDLAEQKNPRIVAATDEQKARARKAAAWLARGTSCCRFPCSCACAQSHDCRSSIVAERPPADLAQQVDAALREDIGSGDVTATLVPAGQSVRGSVSRVRRRCSAGARGRRRPSGAWTRSCARLACRRRERPSPTR